MLIHNAFLSNAVPNLIMNIDEGIVGYERATSLKCDGSAMHSIISVAFTQRWVSLSSHCCQVRIESNDELCFHRASIMLIYLHAFMPSNTLQTSSLSTQLRRLLLLAIRSQRVSFTSSVVVAANYRQSILQFLNLSIHSRLLTPPSRLYAPRKCSRFQSNEWEN